MMGMNAPTITGQRVTLRTVRPEDEATRMRLGWHAAIERNYGHVSETRAMTPEEAHHWFLRQQELAADSSRISWVVEASGSLVGVAFLHSLDEGDSKARFAIGLFSPTDTGQGYGTEATRLVLSHAFESMGLHRVDLRVLAFNEGAIASYRKCGFVEEGRERQSCRFDGQWYDDIIMGILSSEFLAVD
jgi:RimJ/RimL family protein N-acetyltransferase